MMFEEKFWAIIAENLRHCVPRGCFWSSRGALHHRQKQHGPTTTATCYVVRLSQARRRVKPAKDLLLRCGSTEYRCFAWLPTNTIYCPLAHPNPILCLMHRAKRLVQPTTRRGWANAMIFCVAVPFLTKHRRRDQRKYEFFLQQIFS